MVVIIQCNEKWKNLSERGSLDSSFWRRYKQWSQVG